jgi:hypothetical protein
VPEGRNYREFKDSGKYLALTAITLSDVEKALKLKLYLIVEEIKNKLPPEI